MKIRVTWLGRAAASPYEAQVDSYRKRVHRRWPAEDVVFRPAAGGRENDPERVLRLEAEVLLRHHEQGWKIVALDERGRSRSSEAFARWLAGLQDQGVTGVFFVVGSDLGLHPSILDRADEKISLSPMTLPHLLARLLLWEQLFRATHILGGGAYHRV